MKIAMLSFWRDANGWGTAIGLMLALMVAVAGATTANGQAKADRKPDFGPNVLIFDKVYAVQRRSEFGPQRSALVSPRETLRDRYALLFLPGEYRVDVPVGFYTQVLGLGASPDAVHISGNVHADASHDNNTWIWIPR